RRHTRFSRDWSSDVCSSDLDGYDNSARVYQDGDGGGTARFLHANIDQNGRDLDVRVEQEGHTLTANVNQEGWGNSADVEMDGRRSEERRVGKECGAGGRTND